MGQSPADQPDAPPDGAAGDLTDVVVGYSIAPSDDIDYKNSITVGERIHELTTKPRHGWIVIKSTTCGHRVWLSGKSGVVFWANGGRVYCDECWDKSGGLE